MENFLILIFGSIRNLSCQLLKIQQDFFQEYTIRLASTMEEQSTLIITKLGNLHHMNSLVFAECLTNLTLKILLVQRAKKDMVLTASNNKIANHAQTFTFLHKMSINQQLRKKSAKMGLQMKNYFLILNKAHAYVMQALVQQKPRLQVFLICL